MEMTTDFTYIRFHGTTEKYQENYDQRLLQSWAEPIELGGPFSMSISITTSMVML